MIVVRKLIVVDKKPFAGLITSEVEFLVMEARGRVLAIDSIVDMPFSMLLDLALKCHPDQRLCQLKDIHDALVQKLKVGSSPFVNSL